MTGKTSLPATFPVRNPTDVDLKLTEKRKTRNTRRKRVSAPLVGRRSRPGTPLLKWKTEEGEKVEVELEEEDGGQRGGVRGRRKKGASKVSARKLAAGLWRLHLPETVTPSGERMHRLGFKVKILCNSKICASMLFLIVIKNLIWKELIVLKLKV